MKATIRLLTLLFAVSLWSVPAMAVDNIGELEMDGNAVTDQGQKDWDTLMGNPAAADVFTGIESDPSPWSIFEGGRKDIQDITMWRHKDGSVPDKDDITNAYAAAYICNNGAPDFHTECTTGDMLVYFGADRYSNTGDAFLGFWFFKDYVYAKTDGTFNGEHIAGDVLVLVNFPQGANASPEIRALVWDPLCLKEDRDLVSNPAVPEPGTNCAARNLRLRYDGVVCGEEPEDLACAITNTEALFPNGGNLWLPGTIEAPWPYTAKTPDPECPDCFPFESFFEGGLNVTQLVEGGGVDACFASFMVETRSSSSLTATLKDFVIDEFPLCAVTLSKTCGTGHYVYDPVTGMGEIVIPFDVTLDNTGAADVDMIDVVDDYCGVGWGPLGEDLFLAAGDSLPISGECRIPLADYVPGARNGAAADAGEVEVLMGECDEAVDGVCYSYCGVDLSPDISVTKSCEAGLTTRDGLVAVEVRFSGFVTNTSDSGAPTPLVGVSVSDFTTPPIDVVWVDRPMGITLEPGEAAPYSGYYYPDALPEDWVCAFDASFSDTVTVTGDDIHGTTVMDSTTATCALCDTEDCSYDE